MTTFDQKYVETRFNGVQIEGNWFISQVVPKGEAIWLAVARNGNDCKIVHFRSAQNIKFGDPVEIFQSKDDPSFLVAIKKEPPN